MNLNRHLKLEGTHAFLSASKYHWVNKEDDQLIESYLKHKAKQRGTELHDLAEQLIKLKQKLPETTQTLNMYVNDAIGYRMYTEVVLFYSINCYGTADAIQFYEKNKLLRIHDLKTGVTETSFMQLIVYAALYCLQEDVNPNDIDFALRIYQNDEIKELLSEDEPTVKDDIIYVMAKIKHFDRIIDSIKKEGMV